MRESANLKGVIKKQMLIHNYIFHNTWLVWTCEQIKHKKYQPSTEHGVTVVSRFISVSKSFQTIIEGTATSSQFRNKVGIDEGLQ